MIKIGTTVAYHLPGRRLAHRARDERPHAGRDRRGDEEDQEGCDQIWHVGPDRSDEVVECLNPEHVHCDRDRADENQPERDLADESRRLPRDAAHPVARRSLLQPLVQPRPTQNARDQAGDDLCDDVADDQYDDETEETRHPERKLIRSPLDAVPTSASTISCPP
jgi:hypothetical protein